MKECLFELLARFLAWTPIVKFTWWFSKDKPYYHLDNYVKRYWCMPRWMLKKVYRTKENTSDYHLKGLTTFYYFEPKPWVPGLLQLRQHHYFGPDPSLLHHDHPADSRTFVQAGFMHDEVVENDYIIRYEVFGGLKRTAFRPAEQLHRLIKVFESHKSLSISGAKCITLWQRGKTRREWGFVDNDGKWIHNKEYLK